MTKSGARPFSGKVICTYTAEDAKRWRDQWRKGMTLSQIAQKYKVSVSTVTRLMSQESRGELS